MNGDGEGDAECSEPHGHRKQKRGDARVSERVDDGREEVGEGLGEEVTVLQQNEQV